LNLDSKSLDLERHSESFKDRVDTTDLLSRSSFSMWIDRKF